MVDACLLKRLSEDTPTKIGSRVDDLWGTDLNRTKIFASLSQVIAQVEFGLADREEYYENASL